MARCTTDSVLSRLSANHGMDVLLRIQLLLLAGRLGAEEHPTAGDHSDHTEDGNVAGTAVVLSVSTHDTVKDAESSDIPNRGRVTASKTSSSSHCV